MESMELNQYLGELLTTCPYPITFSGNCSNILNKWIVTAELSSQFDEYLKPTLDSKSRILYRNEVNFLSQQEQESNWRYYISNDPISFYASNLPEKMFDTRNTKKIYSLCNVYCEHTMDVLLYYQSFTSVLQMWMNGILVAKSNFNCNILPFFLIFRLNKGNNSLLIERILDPSQGNLGTNLFPFTMTLKPLSYFSDKTTKAFLHKDFFKNIDGSLHIIPDKFCLAEHRCKILVLPKSFLNDKKIKIKITIFNAKKEIINVFTGLTGEEFDIELNNYPSGVIRIEAESLGRKKKTGAIYVFNGDFTTESRLLIQKAEEQLEYRIQENKTIIGAMKGYTSILKISEKIIKEQFTETDEINGITYYAMFEKYIEFDDFLNSPVKNEVRGIFEVFNNYVTIWKNLGIDDNFITYSIYLPRKYNAHKKYPLTILLQYGYGMSKYPRIFNYIKERRFTDTIIVNFCGRGDLSCDYIYGINKLTIINDLIKHLNIDRDRIGLVGTCMGAMEGFEMAKRMPHIFSSLASITGTVRLDIHNPDYSVLDNLNHMMVYDYTLVNDTVFNSGRTLDTLKHIQNTKKTIFSGYSHIEFDELFNNEILVKKVASEKRTKYPKEIIFTTDEPFYNRCYWLKIEYIKDIRLKAVIKGEIRGKDTIGIEIHNIKCFSILINQAQMKLATALKISINGREQVFTIHKYSKLVIIYNDNDIIIKEYILSKDSFNVEYEYIDINEELLGIKQLYFKKCFIVKPEFFKDSSNVFIKKLLFLLQNPLKERLRNYKFDTGFESEVDTHSLSQTNFVLIVDSRKPNQFQQSILDTNHTFVINPTSLECYERRFRGDYFAFIKGKNPFNQDRFILLVIYNNDDVEEEIINFLKSYDSNGLFYSDAVVYHHGTYHSFREKSKHLLSETENE